MDVEVFDGVIGDERRGEKGMTDVKDEFLLCLGVEGL